MDPSAPSPRAGRDVREGDLLGGRYRLGRVLGRGGTASVHAATDEVLRREVAVKVLAPGLATGRRPPGRGAAAGQRVRTRTW